MSALRWSYMDHWRAATPRGPMTQYGSRRLMDDFVKQISAVGFEGLDMFDFQAGELSADTVATAATGWNQVGAATAGLGVSVSLHVDCLSAAADAKTLDALLDATDPALVGLTLDTAELTLAGLDPVAIYQRHRDRVDHVHLKDTRHVDEVGERQVPHAEAAMLQSGGARGIDRWFYECGTPGGLVDFPALLRELRAGRYQGWLIFESEQTPNPARSVMLNGWYARQVLRL